MPALANVVAAAQQIGSNANQDFRLMRCVYKISVVAYSAVCIGVLNNSPKFAP